MKIRIETTCRREYKEVVNEIGKALSTFTLSPTEEGCAEITLRDLDDLLLLSKELNDNLECYFGITLDIIKGVHVLEVNIA